AMHNNCSVKHAGFLCTCGNSGIAHEGYVTADHRLQGLVRDAMEAVTGAAHEVDSCGTDGCSIPTYAVPLRNFAVGFARIATGNGLQPERAKAGRRLMSACMAEPSSLSVTGRADQAPRQDASCGVLAHMGSQRR